MRFIVDAQLPPALAKLLTGHGHTAEHVFDIGPKNASDKSIWDYALVNNAVIITKDEDFGDRVAISDPSPVVVWVRVGNVSKQALLEWFEPQLPNVLRLIAEERTLIELRRLYAIDI